MASTKIMDRSSTGIRCTGAIHAFRCSNSLSSSSITLRSKSPFTLSRRNSSSRIIEFVYSTSSAEGRGPFSGKVHMEEIKSEIRRARRKFGLLRRSHSICIQGWWAEVWKGEQKTTTKHNTAATNNVRGGLGGGECSRMRTMRMKDAGNQSRRLYRTLQCPFPSDRWGGGSVKSGQVKRSSSSFFLRHLRLVGYGLSVGIPPPLPSNLLSSPSGSVGPL